LPRYPQAHLRGGATGRESGRLLNARARIERHLESAPADPHWLQLEARSDLLDERFDPAIDILDRLLAAGPATSGLLVDDAAAYFQRGAATGSENDRATALEYLRRADELAPGDPVVLFNEAVVMEDRGQVMNAVETWNRYLRFERDSRWLAEGPPPPAGSGTEAEPVEEPSEPDGAASGHAPGPCAPWRPTPAAAA